MQVDNHLHVVLDQKGKIICDLENGRYVITLALHLLFLFVLFLVKQIKEYRSVNYKVTNGFICVYYSDNKDKHLGDSKHVG